MRLIVNCLDRLLCCWRLPGRHSGRFTHSGPCCTAQASWPCSLASFNALCMSASMHLHPVLLIIAPPAVHPAACCGQVPGRVWSAQQDRGAGLLRGGRRPGWPAPRGGGCCQRVEAAGGARCCLCLGYTAGGGDVPWHEKLIAARWFVSCVTTRSCCFLIMDVVHCLRLLHCLTCVLLSFAPAAAP
jgi:hypothetical protein